MNKKICMITGSNSGIGKAAAIQIAQQGHRIIMACRSPARSEVALREVKQASGSDDIELMIVDMSLQASIHKYAAAFLAKYETLDVLIHNAAAFDIRQKKIELTAEGVEKVWATNHIGPALLTDLLLDALIRSQQGRIITVSSKGLVMYPRLQVDLEDPEFRQRKFSVQKAYYQSKLAQVMYTYWLVDQLRDTAVTANAIRVTNVKIDIDKRYPGVSKLAHKMYSLKSRFSITPEKMAETYTYLALSDEVSSTSGAYYDDPTHIVNSSKYSQDPQNIATLMETTNRYYK
ncbi:MAG: SDR family NAD(P)-dependent oxidoreductase [Chloroflexi bacterium]|nr:SDR family NAD(P)-dependent oxidoreductase [Chloroflexota bacterium]